MASGAPKRGKKRSAAPSEVTKSAVTETTVFRSGNSDAVRLPKHFNLSGKRVRLRQVGRDRVLLELATRRRWPAAFLATFGVATDDFEAPPRPAHSDADEVRARERFGG